MKVCVIGRGNNGRTHALCLKEVEGVEVAGISDPVAERAKAVADEVGAQAYTDHHIMLKEKRPTAVWISSPNWLHAKHTIDCARAGAHVMCEKPMALNLEDCDRTIAAAKENGVKLMIGQSTRYSNALL